VNNAQVAFDATGLTQVTSATVTLPAPAPAQTATASAATLAPVAGANDAITLTIKDSLGNTDTSFSGAKNVTISGVAQAPDSSYGSFNGTTLTASPNTVAVTFTSGVATPNLSLNKAAAQTIGFSIAGVASPATNSLAITAITGAPTATAATSISFTGFTANWVATVGATGYYLDVATDNGFTSTSILPSYTNKDVGNFTTYGITGLTANTPYYYRVRAYSTGGASASSNNITATTATTLTVINNYDSGAGSLRAAIVGANPGDVITFASNVTGTIALASTLSINKDLTINGPGASNLTINGNGTVQLFQVTGATFTLQNLTLANGNSTNNGGGGGALSDNPASITTITGCVFSGNTAIGAGGAIFATGAMTISNDLFSGNSAAIGGAIANSSTLTLTNVILNGNSAQFGGGIFNGGGSSTIINATIAGNSATTQGGGIDIAGGTLNLENSIIANNTSPSGPDIFGTAISQGYNLVKDITSTTFTTTAGDITGSDPLLGALADNGGPTRTMALLSGSPAIDTGTCFGAPTADQRGMTRPQNSLCDMGAYERGLPAALAATAGTPQSASLNATFATPLATKVVDSLGGGLDGITVAFAGPGSGAGIAADGTANSNTSGIASYVVSANATAGAYTVTATVNSLSAGFSLTNDKWSQTITFANPGNRVYGTTPTLTATASSGLPVTFSSSTTGVCTITSSGALTLITTGTCAINADQAGNGNYSAATGVPQSFSVTAASQGITVTTAAPTSAAYNSQFTVAATASSGLPVSYSSGSASVCTSNGATFTMIAPSGACIVQFNQSGNGNYAAAPQLTSSTSAGKANQTIGMISFSPATLDVGGTTTASATATSGLAITFTSTTPKVCTVSGTTVTGVSTGTCAITASQPGDINYSAAASVSQSLTVAYSSAPPTLIVSTLADGAVTTNPVLNVSGIAIAVNGLTGITYNGAALPFTADGSFSFPVQLAPGANTITVIATDKAGLTTTVTRTITLAPAAPFLTVTYPPDGITTQQESITVTGTFSANTTVTARVNGGSAQTAVQSGADFTVTVSLATGMNTIELTATDFSNARSSVKLTIIYNPAGINLAITSPARDMSTDLRTFTLTGTVSSDHPPVGVSIAFEGETYTPQVTGGAFRQELSLTAEKSFPIVVTATDANARIAVAQRNVIFSMTASGDMNGDGVVDIADALLAMKASVNLMTPTADELKWGDVAPLVNGVPEPDGKIDIEDAMLILRKAAGLTW
jgi:predicted outer membrane repeat protein